MRIVALALAVLALRDGAEAFVDGIRFETPAREGDFGRPARDALENRVTWVAAYRAIEARLGPMPSRVTLRVTYDWDGPEMARASNNNGRGWIRFNLPRVEDHLRKLKDLEAKRADLARNGQTLQFRIPPVRLERVVWHELTHVFQSNYDAPEWFNEGMAQWLSEDPNCIAALAHSGRPVEDVERAVDEKIDLYARGHLFFSWLEARHAVKAVVRASIVERRPWRQAVEQSLGLPWATIAAAEREWSAKEIERFRRVQK